MWELIGCQVLLFALVTLWVDKNGPIPVGARIAGARAPSEHGA
jgi:hypothetical protein